MLIEEGEVWGVNVSVCCVGSLKLRGKRGGEGAAPRGGKELG